MNYLEILDKDKNQRVTRKILIANELLKKHSTPFLIIQQKEILKSINLFKDYLPKIKPFYAVKSNADKYIIELLKKYNFNFDVASAGEIELLDRLKIPGNRMILANPIKNKKSLYSACKNKVWAFTFDNIHELVKLKNYLTEFKLKHIPNAIVRIFTKSEGVQTDLSQKFGAPVEDAIELIYFARELGFNPIGVAFHVGTQSFSSKNYEKSIQDCLYIFENVYKRYNIELEVIDIGGGFPIDTIGGSGTDNLATFFEELSEIYEKYELYKYKVIAEPGRIISGPCGTLVTKIIGKSKRFGKNFLFLDDGVYGCYSGVIYDHAKFNFIPLDKKFLDISYKDRLIPYTLAGPTCDSIDIIDENIFLPDNLEIGDYILSTDIGAYSIMSATAFNGFKPAKVLYLNNNDKLENEHIDIDFDIYSLNIVSENYNESEENN
ncbi:MAG: type III PLP-dependent enzyme [Spirochaetes bacterium]|nr:type III PLP-dependent enzyme [Spirochaetota bacterium]